MKILDTLRSYTGRAAQAMQFFRKGTISYERLFAAGLPMTLLGGDKVVDPYSQVYSVYEAIKAINDNVSQAQLKFFDFRTEKEIYNEELYRLFETPNPLMNRTDFLRFLTGFGSLYDEMFIVKTMETIGQYSGTRLPKELWPFNPKRFTEITTGDGRTITQWNYAAQNGASRFMPEEVMFSRGFNPSNMFRGVAPTSSVDQIIDINYQSLAYNSSFFKNNAMPPYGLATDKQLSEEQRTRILEWFKKQNQGASKAFNLALFENGMKPVTSGPTHSDMQFLEQIRYANDTLIGHWKVPKAMFSRTEDLNYATFQGQIKIFWQYTIMPVLGQIEDMLNKGLIYPYNKNIFCKFDISGVPAFQDDFAGKIDTAMKMQSLMIPLNDINEKLGLGLKAYPWGDIAFTSFSNIPVSQILEQGSVYVQQDNKPVEPTAEALPEAGADPVAPEKAAHKVSDLVKDAKRAAFINRHTPLEKPLERAVSRFLYQQRARLVEAVGKGMFKATGDINSFDWSAEDEKLKKVTTPYIQAGIEAGVAYGQDMLKDGIDIDLLNNQMRQRVSQRVDRIRLLNNVSKERVGEAVNSGIQAGETTQQIADRIRGYYNDISARSLRTARTEITAALNDGAGLYYDESGVMYKQWLTSHDDAVRDSHKQCEDDGVIGKDERFSNGLLFPGDSGPPEEVINCRCSRLPALTPEG